MSFRFLIAAVMGTAQSISATPTQGTIAGLPGDRGFVDVTMPPYDADPTGQQDATSALQRAFTDAVEATRRSRAEEEEARWPRTLYFPPGVYTVSGPLSFGEDRDQIMWLRIIGAGPERSIIRLVEGAHGFDNPEMPVAVVSFFDGDDSFGSNVAFGNYIEEIGIEVGARNPGAIGLLYHNNNTGAVRRVTIRSTEPKGAGTIGLQLGRNLAGIGTVSDVRIEGFDIGVRNGLPGGAEANHHVMYLLERIVLKGQRKVGIETRHKGLSIRRLTSRNAVPALGQPEAGGLLVAIDSDLLDGSDAQAAISNRGWMLLRDVRSSGYGTFLDEGLDPAWPTKSFATGEVLAGPFLSAWSKASPSTLNLEVKETPEFSIDPVEQWAVVEAGTGNDRAAIQAAVDSGRATVYLRPGRYRLDGPIRIGGGVVRFHGGFSIFGRNASFARNDEATIIIEDGSQPELLVEALNAAFEAQSAGPFIRNERSRTLVLRDLFIGFGAAYRNTGTGDLFIENVASGGHIDEMQAVPAWIFRDQRVWARHFNPEGAYPHILSDGSDLWILGMKAGEMHGPYLIALNGSRVELLGGVLNSLTDEQAHPPSRAAIELDQSEASLSLLERSTRRQGAPHAVTVRESWEGRVSSLQANSIYKRPIDFVTGMGVPLYRSARGKAVSGPTAAITRIDDAAEAGEKPGAFLVRLTEPAPKQMQVRYFAGGTARAAEDYETLPGYVDFAEGQTEERIVVRPIERSGMSGTRFAELTLAGGTDYRVDHAARRSSLRIEGNPKDPEYGLEAHYTFGDERIRDNIGGRRPLSVAGQGAEGPLGMNAWRLDGEGIVLTTSVTIPLYGTGDFPHEHRRLRREAETAFMHAGFSARSYAFWFRPDDVDRHQSLLEQGGGPGGMALWLEGGTLHFAGASRRDEVIVSVAVEADWHHVVAVFDHGRLRLYLNGRLVDQAELPWQDVPNQRSGAGLGTVVDGAAGGSEPGNMIGLVSDVRIYNRALSAYEAALLARSPAP